MDPLDAQNQAVVSSHTLMAFQKPQDEEIVMIRPQSLNCPRCDSTNTKFCYYNNYSLSQPRYFCKACKRYWTQGGTLRNVPVGGGCRKNNKRSSPSSSSSSSSYKAQEQTLITTNSNSNQLLSSIPPFPRFENKPNSLFGPFSCFTNGNTNNDNAFAFLDAVRSGILDTHTGQGKSGYGNQEVENNATTTTATIITTTREEYCRERDGENRGLRNFPWHIGGEESKSDTTVAGKECWNGLNGSSWQELLNSPLL